MSNRERQKQLRHWKREVACHFPGLSPVFLLLLAWWSFGMILSRRAALDSVVLSLSLLLFQSTNTMRQRLRDFYKPASAKSGPKGKHKRKDFDVTDCFAPLLLWILERFNNKRLALALDATNVGNRFHVLCISVVYGGIAIPVAWKILLGNQKNGWHEQWCSLLERLHKVVPTDWQVVVLTDRGLESGRLFRAITKLFWHPIMRVKQDGSFKPLNWCKYRPFKQFVSKIGKQFAAQGSAWEHGEFHLELCTLMACWTEGHKEGWFILTDLEPKAANPCWYAYRTWIEQGFRTIKGGLFHWQNTRMKDPGRLERVWLAMALAIYWLVAIGQEIQRVGPIETMGKFGEKREAAKWAKKIRLVTLGLAWWSHAEKVPMPRGKWTDQEWEAEWKDYKIPTEKEFNEENKSKEANGEARKGANAATKQASESNSGASKCAPTEQASESKTQKSAQQKQKPKAKTPKPASKTQQASSAQF